MLAKAFVDNAKVMAKGQVTIRKMFVMFLVWQAATGLLSWWKETPSVLSILLSMLCKCSNRKWPEKQSARPDFGR